MMANVTSEQVDYGKIELYVGNERVAYWYATANDDSAPTTEGIETIVQYLVNRLEQAEARIAALEHYAAGSPDADDYFNPEVA